MSAFTDDKFLGGKIAVRQAVGGFRSGLDAVMVAASVPAMRGEEVLELGAGAGVASLCLAARVAECAVTGVEIDAELVSLANENASSNGVADRVRFAAHDVFALPAELKRDFAHVFSNPPFHGPDGAQSGDDARRRARNDAGRFTDWLEIGVKRTASGGTFTAIFRADRLAEALSVLPREGIVVFPLWPRAGEEAKRVIVQIRKGAGAPLAILSGLVLHESDGQFTREADAILRGGASLALDRPRR